MTDTMKSFFTACIFSSMIVVAGCNNAEIGNAKDVNPETVFFDYNIKALEEGGDVAVRLQYRFGGVEGTTLLLEEPSQVTFDGVVIPVDSSATEGAYYEVVKPFTEFGGEHVILYTASNGKKYQETVEFPVFALPSDLPDTINRAALNIKLEGLPEGDKVQLMLTDTAAYSEGVDREAVLRNGTLQVTAAELAGLREGPVNFQLIRQRILPLKQTTKEGGRLHMTYSVSREFYIR